MLLVFGYRGHTHLYKFTLGGDLALEHLGILPEELDKVLMSDVCSFLMFNYCLRDPLPDKQMKTRTSTHEILMIKCNPNHKFIPPNPRPRPFGGSSAGFPSKKQKEKVVSRISL